MSNWKKEFRDEVKRVLLDRGVPVKYQDLFDEYAEPIPNPYGWEDWEAYQHITGKMYYGEHAEFKPCGYVVPDHVTVTEKTFSAFQGTFSGNTEVVGINMFPVACRCGKYTGLTLRHEGTLWSLLHDLFQDE